MYIKISQKYWTLGQEFALTDENDRAIFRASNKILKLRANLNLLTLGDELLYHMEARFMHFFSYFVISDKEGKEVGFIDEKFHMPGFRRAKMKIGDTEIKIKGGPIHMKAITKDKNGKWDKKHPVVSSAKKMFRIKDTYVAQIDDERLEPALGAVVALWYDMIRYGNQH